MTKLQPIKNISLFLSESLTPVIGVNKNSNIPQIKRKIIKPYLLIKIPPVNPNYILYCPLPLMVLKVII